MLGENEAKNICNKVISLLGKDAGEVILRIDDEYLTRFKKELSDQKGPAAASGG